MKMYDCSKTIDCIHEFRRRCDSIGCNYACPFWGTDNCNLESFDEDEIALLQKWSDEHPEQLKLSKREKEFLTTFSCIEGKLIERTVEGLWVVFVNQNNLVRYRIDDNMFPFISEGEKWYFNKLLGLEVEEC